MGKGNTSMNKKEKKESNIFFVIVIVMLATFLYAKDKFPHLLWLWLPLHTLLSVVAIVISIRLTKRKK